TPGSYRLVYFTEMETEPRCTHGTTRRPPPPCAFGVCHEISARGAHQCDADSMRTDHAEGLCRLRGRTSRVQRRGRPRPPAGLLSTQGRLVQAGQLAEGGLGTDAAQGVRRPRPRALAG